MDEIGFPLILQYDTCPLKMQYILDILYRGSTLCHKDIVQLSKGLIYHVRKNSIEENKKDNMIKLMYRMIRILKIIPRINKEINTGNEIYDLTKLKKKLLRKPLYEEYDAIVNSYQKKDILPSIQETNTVLNPPPEVKTDHYIKMPSIKQRS